MRWHERKVERVEGESKRLCLAAEPGIYRTIITTALWSGARHSELLALR